MSCFQASSRHRNLTSLRDIAKATLPGVLQEKVKAEYDCCVGIDKKDNSTNMKHWFSNNHFRTAVGEELFHLQPMFVCPSFIAMMLGCRSAKYVLFLFFSLSRSDLPFSLPPFPVFSFLSFLRHIRRRGGRYDSADRHCGNCHTFKRFANESFEKGMALSPLLLTRGEFEAIRDFRKQALPGQRCYSPQVQNAVFELLKMMVTCRVSTKGKGKDKAEA